MIETVIEESADILTELVERASEFGYVTTDDIVQMFPQSTHNPLQSEQHSASIGSATNNNSLNNGAKFITLFSSIVKSDCSL